MINRLHHQLAFGFSALSQIETRLVDIPRLKIGIVQLFDVQISVRPVSSLRMPSEEKLSSFNTLCKSIILI